MRREGGGGVRREGRRSGEIEGGGKERGGVDGEEREREVGYKKKGRKGKKKK